MADKGVTPAVVRFERWLVPPVEGGDALDPLVVFARAGVGWMAESGGEDAAGGTTRPAGDDGLGEATAQAAAATQTDEGLGSPTRGSEADDGTATARRGGEGGVRDVAGQTSEHAAAVVARGVAADSTNDATAGDTDDLWRAYWYDPANDVEMAAVGAAFVASNPAGALPHPEPDASAASLSQRSEHAPPAAPPVGAPDADGCSSDNRFTQAATTLAGFRYQLDGVPAPLPADVIALGGFGFLPVGSRRDVPASPEARLGNCSTSAEDEQPVQTPIAADRTATTATATPSADAQVTNTDWLVVPNLLIVRTGGETFAVGTTGESASGCAHGALLTDAAAAQRAGFAERLRHAPTTQPAVVTDDAAYLRLVAEALKAIEAGELQKVVTARAVRATVSTAPEALLARLRAELRGDSRSLAPSGGGTGNADSSGFTTREDTQRAGDDTSKSGAQASEPSAVFCFAQGGSAFLGASPEVLIASDGKTVRSSALAGSRRRDQDPAVDAALGEELLRSPKERSEHQLVVNAIAGALTANGVRLAPIGPPEVEQLNRIQHLHTRIEGQAAAGASVLDLVAALHPTPAVAGQPTEAAISWLAAHEPFSRGWFCGPVGWVTPQGVGEFRVALRCAEAQPQPDGVCAFTLYAGGGIVAGADEQAELAETQTKLATLLAALDGVSSNPAPSNAFPANRAAPNAASAAPAA